MKTILFDCGHAVPADRQGCWIARADGMRICYDCATAADRSMMAHRDTHHFTGQLSPDECWILNGIGGRLAQVISRTRASLGMTKLLRVQSFDGRQWKWMGPRYDSMMTFHLDKERHQ